MKENYRLQRRIITALCFLTVQTVSSGCGRKELSHSAAVGTWAQVPNRRGVSPIVLVFKADGGGTETMGGDVKTQSTTPISWSEKDGVVTYKHEGIGATALRSLGGTTPPCHLSKDRKSMTWGARGQFTLVKR